MAQTFPKQLFHEVQRKNPFWSSWTCFCEVIKGKKNMTPRVVRRYFNLLVDKEDYDIEDRAELIKHLLALRSSETAC